MVRSDEHESDPKLRARICPEDDRVSAATSLEGGGVKVRDECLTEEVEAVETESEATRVSMGILLRDPLLRVVLTRGLIACSSAGEAADSRNSAESC